MPSLKENFIIKRYVVLLLDLVKASRSCYKLLLFLTDDYVHEASSGLFYLWIVIIYIYYFLRRQPSFRCGYLLPVCTAGYEENGWIH